MVELRKRIDAAKIPASKLDETLNIATWNVREFGTNLAKDKRYDQIFHFPIYDDSFMNKGGVLDFFTCGTSTLFLGMSKDDFTYQLSDHLPLWVQINTDNDDHQLDQIIRAKK